jgi:hypothetical protein
LQKHKTNGGAHGSTVHGDRNVYRHGREVEHPALPDFRAERTAAIAERAANLDSVRRLPLLSS